LNPSLSSLGLGVVEGGVEFGSQGPSSSRSCYRTHLQVCIGKGRGTSVEGPVSIVHDVVLFKEDEDSLTLFVSDLGNIEYGKSGVVCEVCEGGCLVGEIVE
jgi:hypothetical protein